MKRKAVASASSKGTRLLLNSVIRTCTVAQVQQLDSKIHINTLHLNKSGLYLPPNRVVFHFAFNL